MEEVNRERWNVAFLSIHLSNLSSHCRRVLTLGLTSPSVTKSMKEEEMEQRRDKEQELVHWVATRGSDRKVLFFSFGTAGHPFLVLSILLSVRLILSNGKGSTCDRSYERR